MSVRTTASETTDCLLRGAAVVLAGVVAMALVSHAVDPLLELFDTGLPWRQLASNRTMSSLALSGRVFCALVVACVFLRLPDTGSRRVGRAIADAISAVQDW